MKSKKIAACQAKQKIFLDEITKGGGRREKYLLSETKICSYFK